MTCFCRSFAIFQNPNLKFVNAGQRYCFFQHDATFFAFGSYHPRYAYARCSVVLRCFFGHPSLSIGPNNDRRNTEETPNKYRSSSEREATQKRTRCGEAANKRLKWSSERGNDGIRPYFIGRMFADVEFFPENCMIFLQTRNDYENTDYQRPQHKPVGQA